MTFARCTVSRARRHVCSSSVSPLMRRQNGFGRSSLASSRVKERSRNPSPPARSSAHRSFPFSIGLESDRRGTEQIERRSQPKSHQDREQQGSCNGQSPSWEPSGAHHYHLAEECTVHGRSKERMDRDPYAGGFKPQQENAMIRDRQGEQDCQVS